MRVSLEMTSLRALESRSGMTGEYMSEISAKETTMEKAKQPGPTAANTLVTSSVENSTAKVSKPFPMEQNTRVIFQTIKQTGAEF